MSRNGNTIAITADRVFDGEQFLHDHCVIVQGDTITALAPAADCPSDIEVRRVAGGTLAPGLIDLQVNGGGDLMLHNAPTVSTLTKMQAAHRALGTTSILPTLLSDTLEVQRAAVDAVTATLASAHAGIHGLHIEGPFFNTSKRGAHQVESIRRPAASDIDWLCSLQSFTVMLTLAPEQVSGDTIKQLTDSGILVCAGHTAATYSQLTESQAHGVQGITHLFNAMSPLNSREPGVVGAALDNDAMWAGIIADGHHVHPASIRLAHRCKPAGKLLLVSDAMATVGGQRDSFELYGEHIGKRDGRLVNADGALAGSAISLMDAVCFSHHQVGLPLDECLRMASAYPANVLGKSTTLGYLAPGYRADMVHFDADFLVHNTWLAGEHLSHQPRSDPT